MSTSSPTSTGSNVDSPTAPSSPQAPLQDVPELSAVLVINARNREHVDELIADDPFVVEGLLTELTVVKWHPGFGELRHHVDT